MGAGATYEFDAISAEIGTRKCYQISRNTRNILPPFDIPPFTGSLGRRSEVRKRIFEKIDRNRDGELVKRPSCAQQGSVSGHAREIPRPLFTTQPPDRGYPPLCGGTSIRALGL